jgi:hypothetical protein
MMTLGVIENDDGHGNPIYGASAPYGLFDGQDPADGDVLVKYTLYGDADLNGVIDGRDYSRIDIGYQDHLTGWVNGDFNYDGVVDGSDYTLIDNSFNEQLANPTDLIATDTSIFSSSVPEPGSLGLIAAAFAAGLWTKRRLRRDNPGYVPVDESDRQKPIRARALAR